MKTILIKILLIILGRLLKLFQPTFTPNSDKQSTHPPALHSNYRPLSRPHSSISQDATNKPMPTGLSEGRHLRVSH